MSVETQIQRIKDSIESAYTAILNKNGVAYGNSSDQLATSINSIQPSVYYGMDVNEAVTLETVDGVLQHKTPSTTEITLSFNGVKEIQQPAFCSIFVYRDNIKAVSFPQLKKVYKNALYNTFASTEVATAEFPMLESVLENGMESCLSQTLLTTVSFPALKTVGQYGLSGCFYYCTNLTSVSFPALQTIDAYGLANTFYGCTSLSSISFPSLTTVNNLSFYYPTFTQCTALTEIHFRADMRTKIEAINGYSSKWGAVNATIYFDL